MKTKTFLFATTFMMMAACMMMNTSCTKYAMDDVVENGGSQEAVDGKEHVKLNLSAAVPEAETRGSLQVDGKELTDIFILDYDKTSGKLLQVLHQTNSAADFAEPDMTLAYGEHTLKVIATRSISPTLLDADKADWAIDDNVLTAISNSEPASWTSTRLRTVSVPRRT